MSNVRQKSSSKAVRRTRERQGRRLRLEALERRDCPAVLFDFDGGVLNLTGDDQRNVIEIIQRGDGAAEVLADGERRSFNEVSKIVVNAAEEDDQVSVRYTQFLADGTPVRPATNSPFILELDAGEGNDTLNVQTGDSSRVDLNEDAGSGDDGVTIGDNDYASVTGRITGVVADPMDAAINLGTGADKLIFQVEHHGTVNVDVNSADSFDSVQIGVKRPLSTPIRLLDTRVGIVDINLAGVGHLVDVQTDGLDDLELNLAVSADRAPSDPSGNTIYVSTSGGGVWRSAAQDNREAAARLKMDLGGGDNLVDVNTNGFDEIDLELRAEGDNNVVKHELGHTLGFRHEHTRPETNARADIMLAGDGNRVGFNTRGYEQVDLDLDLTGNGNTVAIGLLLPAVQKVREAAARVEMELDGGVNFVDVRTENIGNVDFSIVSAPAEAATGTGIVQFSMGDGSVRRSDDGVVIRYSSVPGGSAVPHSVSATSLSFSARAGDAHSAPSMKATLKTGAGDDTVSIWTRGVDDCRLDITTGAGNDTLVVDSQTSFPYGGFTGGVRVASGDVNLGEGNDVADIKIQGYSDVSLDLTAGSGDDRVGIVKFGSKLLTIQGEGTYSGLRVDLGSGNDRLVASSQGFSDVSTFVDAGAGNDAVNVRHRMFAVVDRSNLSVVVLLGAGSDTLALESSGYRQIKTELNTGRAGDGRDRISTSHHSLRKAGRVQNSSFNLDGRSDVSKHRSVGYTSQVEVIGTIVVEYLVLGNFI
jgi:hypothetical protein